MWPKTVRNPWNQGHPMEPGILHSMDILWRYHLTQMAYHLIHSWNIKWDFSWNIPVKVDCQFYSRNDSDFRTGAVQTSIARGMYGAIQCDPRPRTISRALLKWDHLHRGTINVGPSKWDHFQRGTINMGPFLTWDHFQRGTINVGPFLTWDH